MVRMLIVDYSHIPSLGLPSKLQFGIEVLRIIFFFHVQISTWIIKVYTCAIEVLENPRVSYV